MAVEKSIAVLEKKEDKKADSCGIWAVVSVCSSGKHQFAKKIYCGKEWCPVCGKNRSASHNRKIARVLGKAMQIKDMGYLVIEFPDVYRKLGKKGIEPDSINNCWCYSKEDLQNTTNSIVDVLAGKRMASKRRVGGHFKRGLIRWHWFGDKIPGKWNPHCNVIVDSAFIEKTELEKIKTELKEALNCPELIVHYSYVNQPGQKFQKIEYITRATFLKKEWCEYMANELYNFRNQRWWGKWGDKPEWTAVDIKDDNIPEILAINKLQDGKCPDCGMPLKILGKNKKTGHEIRWTKPVDTAWLIIWDAEEIAETGYYRIPVPKCEKTVLSVKDILT